MPARQSVANLPEFQAFPANAGAFFESLNDIKPIPSPPNFAEVEGIFMRHMQLVMADAVTPEQAMTDAHEELSAAMAKLQ